VFAALGINPLNKPIDDDWGSLLARMQNYCGKNAMQAQLSTFSLAWNGFAFRIEACRQHNDAFTASIRAFGNAPASDQRSVQERELFAFFSTAISATETLYYGIYVVGNVLKNADFPLPQPQNLFYPNGVAVAFRKAYPGDGLTVRLQAVSSDPYYRLMRNRRNVLSHNGQPPRNFVVGGPPQDPNWAGFAINDHTTTDRFDWIMTAVENVLADADDFAQRMGL